jgi:hypothetical protein
MVKNKTKVNEKKLNVKATVKYCGGMSPPSPNRRAEREQRG